MKFVKLFEMQKALDTRIELEHPRVEGEDRLGKKILALQVELGELANELPEVFKFWSNKKNDYEKALKEYVDGLHFILSIGLEYELPLSQFAYLGSELNETIVEQFIMLNVVLTETFYTPKEHIAPEYRQLIELFIGLGEMLGFTWEQIEAAYYLKNSINHERQNTGY